MLEHCSNISKPRTLAIFVKEQHVIKPAEYCNAKTERSFQNRKHSLCSSTTIMWSSLTKNTMLAKKCVPDTASPCVKWSSWRWYCTVNNVFPTLQKPRIKWSSLPSVAMLKKLLHVFKTESTRYFVKNHDVIKSAKYCDAAKLLDAFETEDTRSLCRQPW